jgi:hypothetical protein
MASLLELATIQVNSLADPGEPPDPDIVAARDLRGRVRMLLVRKAYAFIEATPNPEGQPQLEQLAFAQQAFRNPDSHTPAMFNLVLANAPTASTPAQILGATDTQLDAVLSLARLALLAKGLRLG